MTDIERRLAAEKKKAFLKLVAWFDKRGGTQEERKVGMNTVSVSVNVCVPLHCSNIQHG